MKRLALCLVGICFFVCGAAVAQDGGDPSGDANCATNPCLATYHNNNNRNGLNSHEKVLVANATQFPPPGWGTAPTQVKLDSIVYAQPLYAYGVLWTGPTGSAGCPTQTTSARNMLYVATENNTLYAIDADNYGICTSLSLNSSDNAIPVSQVGNGACDNLSGSKVNGTVGITGTPVIDPNHNMLFVVSSHVNGSGAYAQRLNFVDITTLSRVTSLNLAGPINANMPSGYPTFYAQNADQRAGLTLTKIGTSGANIYVAWGTYCDSHDSSLGGSFGLVAEFDFDYTTQTFASTLEDFYVQGANTDLSSPTGNPAGVWMAGGAPAADGGGNVYIVTGNGNFEGVSTNGSPLNFGNSIVKLGSYPSGGGSFGEEDFYTPNVWKELNSGASNVSCGTDYLCTPCPPCTLTLSQQDWDLGSGGVVLLTSSSASGYGEMVAGGKEGMFYVTYYCSSSTQCPTTTSWNGLMGGLDGGGYGHDTGSLYNVTPCTTGSALTTGAIAQCFYGELVAARKDSGQRGTPAYWPSGSTPYLYTVGIEDGLKAYPFTTSTGQFTVNVNPAESSSTYKFPGATPVITSNGPSFASAVVWVLDTHAYLTPTNNQAVLTAYAAQPSGSTLTQLWNSGTSGPGAVKFTIPTIANGKVYVPGQAIGTVGGCGTGKGCAGLLMIYH